MGSANYIDRLKQTLDALHLPLVQRLEDELRRVWTEGNTFFICGNGGSAGNAIHLANDFIYGVSPTDGKAIRVTALSANPAVLTCLANDIGYQKVYSQQLHVLGSPGDLLLVLSGSGNSANVVEALKKARELGVVTAAILGYSGGQCKELAEIPIHIPVEDMQIAEDMQLIIGHMLMQALCKG